ncbi:PREDICTED: uncharacterized protein LOC104816285 [Tarenaya hassleriana]|uniref:uncharacterized protein LOC104816285 n=1 Tax=Tarenaya hassleriana TaxID=28532 RepID=UPI00053CA51C|nr:PREDICTED: uncharacterized protein LOC104816285 [Tarenaya hassleriana]
MQSRRAVWLKRLELALRTALSCLLVSLTTLYGPEPLKHFTKFPAFSYLTTIIILSSNHDSSLGDVLRGCVHASYATFQMMGLALVSLRMVPPAWLSSSPVAAAAVALAVFIVALPESTSLLAKRVAFGQIVILYVSLVIFEGEPVHPVMHPVQVAASTALGAIASLLAMLVPFPRLAHSQMKSACRSYGENASERMNLFVKAVIARDNTEAQPLIAQAGSFSATARSILQTIKLHNEGMTWERPETRFFGQKQKQTDLGQKLQGMEIPLRGMELALGSCRSFPIYLRHEELRHSLESSREQIALGSSILPGSVSALKTKDESKPRWHLEVGSLSPPDLPVCFFWCCVELLRGDLLPCTQNNQCINKANTKEVTGSENEGSFKAKRIWDNLFAWMVRERLVFALKCSVSLGLAVLFGLMYNREHAYWSGLTIAISLVTGRQATFALANARLQGTAMGSVYSLLCCSVFHRLEEFRFLPLLPWIVFTGFLRHSRMYGQAGGISAAIGAVLILGRRNYRSPTEFAIARIVEVSIGLLCFIFTELLFNPARAATLAKTELSHCLEALQDCIQCLILCSEQENGPVSVLKDLRKKQAKLKNHVDALENFIAEAMLEPNFWFHPFNATCYKELLGSFSNIADLCLYISDGLTNLSRVQPICGFAWEELQDHITHDLKSFKEKLDSSAKCFEEIISVNSLARFQKELQKRKICHDIEAGKQHNSHSRMGRMGPDQEDVERFSASFLLLLKEAADKISSCKAEEVLKSRTVLCLSSLGFCTSKLMQETIAIKTGVFQIT